MKKRFEELKTDEEILEFIGRLKKLKMTELPLFKEEYEGIKFAGTITQEQHDDTICVINYKRRDGEWFNTILAEQTKTDKNGESFRDVYYIDPHEPGIVYVEHRYLIDNDNPRRKSAFEKCFPKCQKDWEYLWRNGGEE